MLVIQAGVALRVVQMPDVQVSPETAVWPRQAGGLIRVDTVAVVVGITSLRPMIDAGGGATITCTGEGGGGNNRWSLKKE